jgi:hypothetical protein
MNGRRHRSMWKSLPFGGTMGKSHWPRSGLEVSDGRKFPQFPKTSFFRKGHDEIVIFSPKQYFP